MMWFSTPRVSLVWARLQPSDWIQKHLLQLAMGLIPCGMVNFIPSSDAWVVRPILRDFHYGLVARLAEVLRRRQLLSSIIFLSRQTNPPS